MPNCGRAARIRSSKTVTGWTVDVSVQPAPMRDHFVSLIRRVLPREVEIQVGAEPYSILLSSRRSEHAEPTRAFLELLHSSMTIEDEADASHALGLHWFADIKERSQLGDLVEQAKDYGPNNPSDPRAAHWIQQASLDWLTAHPLFASADGVAAIPGTQPKEFDLPAVIAATISSRFGMRRIQLRSRNQTPQKGQPGPRPSRAKTLSAMMNADRSALGKRVLLIDDLYRSGDTMMAGARALRRAGATAVYCLALTKTARHCNGLPASVDNWPDRLPGVVEVEGADLPFC